MLPRVLDETGGGIDRYSQRAGADGEVRVGHADEIDHQRHRKDRSAAIDKAELEPDQAARHRAEGEMQSVDH